MQDTITLVGIVYALTEVAKTAGLPSKYSPLFALAIGMLMSFVMVGGDPLLWLAEGIVAGLTASGLYSQSKALAK